MIDMTDAEKLRVLAEWLDAIDSARPGDHGDEVQRDLRRIADRLEGIDGE